jgi:hypothetical protein
MQILAAPKLRNITAQGNALIFIHISRRVRGIFGPNGTFHYSPAHSAGLLDDAWDPVLQGRFMPWVGLGMSPA